MMLRRYVSGSLLRVMNRTPSVFTLTLPLSDTRDFQPCVILIDPQHKYSFLLCKGWYFLNCFSKFLVSCGGHGLNWPWRATNINKWVTCVLENSPPPQVKQLSGHPTVFLWNRGSVLPDIPFSRGSYKSYFSMQSLTSQFQILQSWPGFENFQAKHNVCRTQGPPICNLWLRTKS